MDQNREEDCKKDALLFITIYIGEGNLTQWFGDLGANRRPTGPTPTKQ